MKRVILLLCFVALAHADNTKSAVCVCKALSTSCDTARYVHLSSEVPVQQSGSTTMSNVYAFSGVVLRVPRHTSTYPSKLRKKLKDTCDVSVGHTVVESNTLKLMEIKDSGEGYTVTFIGIGIFEPRHDSDPQRAHNQWLHHVLSGDIHTLGKRKSVSVYLPRFEFENGDGMYRKHIWNIESSDGSWGTTLRRRYNNLVVLAAKNEEYSPEDDEVSLSIQHLDTDTRMRVYRRCVELAHVNGDLGATKCKPLSPIKKKKPTEKHRLSIHQ